MVVVGLILISAFMRYVMLDGSDSVALPPASRLAGPVSSVLGPGALGTENSLPQIGKEYAIKDIRYFDNKKWVVVKILPLKNKADPAILVLEKINGVYQSVLGPAGNFSASYVYVLPKDVGVYLSQQGVFGG